MLFLCGAAAGFAQSRPVCVANSFSYDRLPDYWQKKHRLLRQLDDVLPQTIDALATLRSCVNCEADYYITLGMDSLYMRDRMDASNSLVWGPKDAVDYEGAHFAGTGKLLFSVLSHLSVWDASGRERYRLVLTDSTDFFQLPGTNETMRVYTTIPLAASSLDTRVFPIATVVERLLYRKVGNLQKRLQRRNGSKQSE